MQLRIASNPSNSSEIIVLAVFYLFLERLSENTFIVLQATR